LNEDMVIGQIADQSA